MTRYRNIFLIEERVEEKNVMYELFIDKEKNTF